MQYTMPDTTTISILAAAVGMPYAWASDAKQPEIFYVIQSADSGIAS